MNIQEFKINIIIALKQLEKADNIQHNTLSTIYTNDKIRKLWHTEFKMNRAELQDFVVSVASEQYEIDRA